MHASCRSDWIPISGNINVGGISVQNPSSSQDWTRKILTEQQYQARLDAAKTEYPLRRGIWPRDVAVAALFLVEGAVTMTGECIRMDCGQHLGDTSNKT